MPTITGRRPQVLNTHANTTNANIAPSISQTPRTAGGAGRKAGAGVNPVWITVFTVTVTLAPSVPGVKGFWLKLQEMVGSAGLEVHESAVGVPFAAPIALIGKVYAAGKPAVTVLVLGDGMPNEKSHVPPKKLNVSVFEFPFTGSATNTGTPPLHTTSAAGTVALRLVALAAVGERLFPLKLTAD
jgi:hypothetical protein